ELHSDLSHPAGAFIAGAGDGYTTSESIDVVALDDWVEDRGLDRVDLVKLDIEGAEPSALRGARRTIERCRSVLLVEFNPLSLLRFGGVDPDDFYDQIAAVLPHVMYVDGDGRLRRILSRAHLHRLLQV